LTQKFGTDALRYMLASMAAPGTDIILSEDRILGARAFANKIWNAARFLFMNLEKAEASTGVTLEELAAPEIRAKAPYAIPGEDGLIHRWIFSRLSSVSAEVNAALQDFRFHEACQTIYHFFWGDFCDWYIEWVKPQLSSENREVSVAAWRNIFAALETALRLLHPVMPCLTEELWHRLPQPEGARSIALDKFPEPRSDWNDANAEGEIALIQKFIEVVRNLRASAKIDAKKKTAAEYASDDPDVIKVVNKNYDAILRLGTLSDLQLGEHRIREGVVYLTGRLDIWLIRGVMSPEEKEETIAKLKKEIDRLAKDVSSKQSRLADETFISKAPAKIVEDLRNTLASRQIEHQKLLERLDQLA
jgi:valyl-tRNA synthetase